MIEQSKILHGKNDAMEIINYIFSSDNIFYSRN
jgi:hypothetical protein